MNKCLQKIIEFSLITGFNVKNLSFSPITGGDGNIEFLLHLRWAGEEKEDQFITGHKRIATDLLQTKL